MTTRATRHALTLSGRTMAHDLGLMVRDPGTGHGIRTHAAATAVGQSSRRLPVSFPLSRSAEDEAWKGEPCPKCHLKRPVTGSCECAE